MKAVNSTKGCYCKLRSQKLPFIQTDFIISTRSIESIKSRKKRSKILSLLSCRSSAFERYRDKDFLLKKYCLPTSELPDNGKQEKNYQILREMYLRDLEIIVLKSTQGGAGN